jgi:glyoxylase-like metal-dependent hydrolase (beta-lactamase superfamily II)
VVADPSTRKAVIIDPVLDYDANSLMVSTHTADALAALVSGSEYRIEKILETHAHADHLTAASYLQERLSSQQGLKPPICIGKRIREVQERFAARYAMVPAEYESAFDHLFQDDEKFEIGCLSVEVMHLPGHTPDHVGYRIGGKRSSKDPWLLTRLTLR